MALGSDAARQGADVKAAFEIGIKAYLEILGRLMVESDREDPAGKAMVVLSTMVGAMTLSRAVNEGFSGGEKKRNEIFQMAVLEPKLAILDETDSGLDIDALKIVANGVNALRSPQRSIIVVTHYQRLLNYIIPDFVHVLYEGKIVKSGKKDLALELEHKGYGWLGESMAAGEPARP